MGRRIKVIPLRPEETAYGWQGRTTDKNNHPQTGFAIRRNSLHRRGSMDLVQITGSGYKQMKF
jgi:hypothetical protein